MSNDPRDKDAMDPLLKGAPGYRIPRALESRVHRAATTKYATIAEKNARKITLRRLGFAAALLMMSGGYLGWALSIVNALYAH